MLVPTIHCPDGWTILKFDDGEKIVYKIFATWREENDKWKLSSGAPDLSALKKEGDKFVWKQASGSIYHLPVDGELSYTEYQGQVLESIKSSCIKQNVHLSILEITAPTLH
jgi:hypothetical protein